MRYICTSCTLPTSSLYKVYSTPGSIQLTTCKGCGNDVDPYIEREWLLVVMDCVLYRPEAFRHALYNREPFATIFCGDNVDHNNKFGGLRQLMRYSFIAALIRTYLWHATTTDEEDVIGTRSAKLLVFLCQSLVGENFMAIATIVSASIIVKMSMRTRTSDSSMATSCKIKTQCNDASSSFFYSRLYLAVALSSFFHLVTIFAIIWDNSATVCLLGTLFVLSLQRMGVATVVDERLRREMDTKTVLTQDVSLRLKQSIPLVAGIAARTLCSHIASKAVGNDSDCIGIPIKSSIGSFCIS